MIAVDLYFTKNMTGNQLKILKKQIAKSTKKIMAKLRNIYIYTRARNPQRKYRYC